MGEKSNFAKQYLSYVHTKYGENCFIVFDGYEQGPSIKDHENQRRAKKTCADIILSEDMEAYKYQQVFLINERNKSQFISLLSKYLVDDGHIVHHSIGDADTLIIQSALELAAKV